MKIKELLAVLDMLEVEQYCWLCDHRPEYGYVITAYPENPDMVLADLAFRLRDEVMNFNKGAWYDATEQVWRECHNYREYRNFWVDRSKPIHWIIAALIAKELSKNTDGKNLQEH